MKFVEGELESIFQFLMFLPLLFKIPVYASAFSRLKLNSTIGFHKIYLVIIKLYITFFLSFHILSNVRKALFYRLYEHFHFLFTFAYRGISSYVFPLKRGKFRGKYFYAIRRFISVLALSIEECAYQSIVILILE